MNQQGSDVPVRYEPTDELVHSEHSYYPANYYPTSAEAQEMDWRRLWSLIREKMGWILAASVLGGVVGFVVSRFQEPVYKTTAKVYLEQTDQGSGPIREGDVFEGAGWTGVFTSNSVLEPVVRQFRLYVQPVEPKESDLFKNFKLGDAAIGGRYHITINAAGTYELTREQSSFRETGSLEAVIGKSAGFAWSLERNRVSPGSQLVFDVRRPERVAMQLRKQLDVYYDKDAGLIQSELLWPDPAQGAQIHNALINRFISTSLELKNRKLRETVQILRDQYAYSTQRLKDAELSLQQFRIEAITQPTEPRQSVIADGLVARDPIFDSYFNKKIQRDMVSKDVREIQDILARAQAGEPLNILRLQTVPSVANSAPLQAALADLNTKIVDRRTKLYTWTEEHPEVRRVTAEIEQLRSRTIPVLAGQLVEDLKGQASAIQADIASATKELREIPTRTIEEGRRRRQFELAEKLHNNLLDRLNNAMLAERTSLPDLQVLDYAFAPRRPTTSTGPIFFLLIGGLVGMSVGLVGVMVHDKLDTRIHHPFDISDKFGLPLLGVVPKLNLNGRNPVATASALESFRSIRTQIAHAGNGSGNQILVTSSVPREGKSTVAANLAISCAGAGYRTLLLDVDVRRGRTYELFGLSRAPGLTDYLLGRESLEGVIQFYEPASLEVITAGSLSGYNPELLDSERMYKLLKLLGERYDVVMLDGPPLASGADVLLLGERCDKVVMVFRAGTTSFEMVKTRLDLLGNVQLPIIGAVLNAVPESAPYYDQYVSSYYYAEAEATS